MISNRMPWKTRWAIGICIGAISSNFGTVIAAIAMLGAALHLRLWQPSIQERQVSVLNGEVLEVNLKYGSSRLKRNLAIGKEINQYVRIVVPYTQNFMERTKTFASQDIASQQIAMELVTEALEYVREDYDLPIFEIAKIVEKFRVGNCEEMSFVGLKYAIDRFGIDFPIEPFSIKNGDHSFLVIGRDPSSLASDYKNWGSNAVICDPWTGACYPASELEEYLRDFAGPIEDNEIEYTAVNRFNPKRQSLVSTPISKDELLAYKACRKPLFSKDISSFFLS